jgi:ribA/ribD-fused uncharacterized protein
MNLHLFYNGPFSQWYASPFESDDFQFKNDDKQIVRRHYTCAEMYMMAAKAYTFQDKKTFDKIMSCKRGPKVIKELGRSVVGFDETIWSAVAQQHVIRGNLLKFQQNPKLKQVLLATGNQVLAEASPYDTIWGIGLSIKHPDAKRRNKWKGTNWLGLCLMDVRRQLSSSSSSSKNV